MGIEAKFSQGRNEPCGCGSGLKFKHCHGDSGKRAVCEHYVQEVMLWLIMKEKRKQNLISQAEYAAFTNKTNGKTEKQPVTELDVGEIMDKAKLKRCSGALCGAPIPDTQELCIDCQSKLKGKL